MKYHASHVIIILFTFMGCLVIGFGFMQTNIVPAKSIRSPKKFKFFQDWDYQTDELNSISTDFNIVEESFLISETVHDFINLVLQEFVDSWFDKISSNKELFQGAIKREFALVVVNFKDRLKNLDLANLLVKKLLPLITDHFQRFIAAQDSVRENHPEYDLMIANSFSKLHKGVTVGTPSKNGGSLPLKNEKNFLRAQIEAILPYLLSKDEQENNLVRPLIREILSSTVLTNLFQMLSEGDFYNVLIVQLIGTNLRHRTQVKKLRAALEEHTKPNTKEKFYILKENTTTDAFKEILQKITKLSSLSELKEIIAYTDNAGVGNNKRIGSIKEVANKRINQLNRKFGVLTLSEVLDSIRARECFQSFLDKKSIYVKFWVEVERLKAPLEDITFSEQDEQDDDFLSLGFSNTEDMIRVYNLYFYNNILNFPRSSIEILDKFVNSDKNNAVDADLYKKSRKELFKLQNDVYKKLEFEFDTFKLSPLYEDLVEEKVRKHFELNKDTYVTRFNEEISTSNENTVSPVVMKAVEDAFTEIMKSGGEVTYDPLANSTTISTLNMKRNLFGENSSLFGGDEIKSDNRHSKLFDEKRNSKLFEDSDIDTDGERNSDNDSKLEESVYDSPMDSSFEAVDRSMDQEVGDSLLLAGPGNLKLTEEIAKLDEEIEKLSEQHAILAPLLQKAELTNNIGELKILKRSSISLEREISSKELQKQQYIVQESDNSLFGKSKVSIQSYISGSDKGKEVILYIIEVQKISNDNPNLVSAGWIVARRFSQFYQLNEYLKAKYTSKLTNIKFPNRIVSVLKFQQEQIIELRKIALKEYLQQVIQIPEVCGDRIFRNFLSSENFNIGKNQLFDPRNKMESVAKSIYDRKVNSIVRENLAEMQNELNLYDNERSGSFVRPICDLLISIFRLNTSKTWIRGRAIIVILQQLFGTTIEKMSYEMVEVYAKREEKVLDILTKVKNIVFPNRKFKGPPVIRSIYEKNLSKNEAKIYLDIWFKESCSKIFGTSNSSWASSQIFNMLQNDFLNRHLLFTLLEQILQELFKELETNWRNHKVAPNKSKPNYNTTPKKSNSTTSLTPSMKSRKLVASKTSLSTAALTTANVTALRNQTTPTKLQSKTNSLSAFNLG